MRNCIVLGDKEFNLSKDSFISNSTIESNCLFVGKVTMDSCIVFANSTVESGNYERMIFYSKTKIANIPRKDIGKICVVPRRPSVEEDPESSGSEISPDDLVNVQDLNLQDKAKKTLKNFAEEMLSKDRQEFWRNVFTAMDHYHSNANAEDIRENTFTNLRNLRMKTKGEFEVLIAPVVVWIVCNLD